MVVYIRPYWREKMTKFRAVCSISERFIRSAIDYRKSTVDERFLAPDACIVYLADVIGFGVMSSDDVRAMFLESELVAGGRRARLERFVELFTAAVGPDVAGRGFKGSLSDAVVRDAALAVYAGLVSLEVHVACREIFGLLPQSRVRKREIVEAYKPPKEKGIPVLSFDAERAADENLEQMISDVDERILYYQGVKKTLRGRLRWRKFAEKRDGRADSDGAPRRRRRDTATAVALRHSFVGQSRELFIESFVEDIIQGGRFAPEVVEKGSDEVPQDPSRA